ncbi:MAG: hypothetical protein V5A30_05465 [Haloarculaceae archaeon]
MSGRGLLGRVVTSRLGAAVSRFCPGTPVWEREWDICCVLDGCRVDLMREVAGEHRAVPGGSVESVWSVGSQSAEWMDVTFGPAHREELARTAYVTGNPFTAQSADHVLVTSGETLPLDPDEWGLLYEAWREEWVDDRISTIPPDPLTDAALAVWNRRAELGVDRVLVHYMQPHAPFRSRPEWFLGTADIESWGQIRGSGGDGGDDSESQAAETAALTELSPEELAELERLSEAETDGIKDPWTRLRDGELPREEFWAAYRDNLRWVLDDVARLLEGTTARVALTSDHGNAAGEWGVWSHPPGVPIPALRKVPWVSRRGTGERNPHPPLPEAIAGAGDRAREDRNDETADGAGVDDGVEERLADLGYR